MEVSLNILAQSSQCPPGTTESNPPVNCGRGGTPCEKGYDCVIAPDDTYAVCCSNSGKIKLLLC